MSLNGPNWYSPPVVVGGNESTSCLHYAQKHPTEKTDKSNVANDTFQYLVKQPFLFENVEHRSTRAPCKLRRGSYHISIFFSSRDQPSSSRHQSNTISSGKIRLNLLPREPCPHKLFVPSLPCELDRSRKRRNCARTPCVHHRGQVLPTHLYS